MNVETFTAQALALKARADGAATNEERTQIIAAVHQLVKFTPVSFCLDVKTALFGLADTLEQAINTNVSTCWLAD